MFGRILDGIKAYWVVIVLVVVAALMLTFTINQVKAVRELESDIASTKESLEQAKAEQQELSQDFDAEKHQEQIKERTVSAQEIGKEMIAVDDELTAFYKTNEPMPEDDKERQALLDRVEELKEKNTELTGATEADHIMTWQLNPDWSMELDSVVTYQDTDKVPVVFSMKTGDGKNAGLIYAIYDVDNHRLGNISRHYTTDGLKDEVDVGGM